MALRILAVDDEELNIDIMQEYFEEANFKSKSAINGQEALDILNEDKDFNVIVLDRMMPVMDGMEFIKQIKQNPELKDIPVIMQTAATSSQQVTEGIEAGVYYYLNKPYTKEVFLSLIHAANDDFARRKELKAQIKEYSHAMATLDNAKFTFKTIDEAKALSLLIGSAAEKNEAVIFGLTELMINAVEHGNLGITYKEKGELKVSGTWEDEIQKRLKNPKYKKLASTMEVCKKGKEMEVTITDMGEGFDWKQFMTPSPERLMDPNGRGVLMSLNSEFTKLAYIGKGNVVKCSFKYIES